MSTIPRIPAELAAGFTMLTDGGDSPAAKIAIPAELTRLSGIPIAVEGSVTLDPVVHECIRLFNAKYQGCEYCMNARQAVAIQAGLNEDIVSKLTRFETSDLPPQIKAALRITSAVASAPQMVTKDVLDEARRHFSEQEVADIIYLSVLTTASKVAITLGVEPGKSASSRVFYPSDPVYGDSDDLKRALEAYAKKGFNVAGEAMAVPTTLHDAEAYKPAMTLSR